MNRPIPVLFSGTAVKKEEMCYLFPWKTITCRTVLPWYELQG